MKKLTLQLVFIMAIGCGAFYEKWHTHHKKIKQVRPKTIEELKVALCGNMTGGKCDDEPRIINIHYRFDLTKSEGFNTEVGCYHLSTPIKCKLEGQLKLNVNNQCNGLEPTNVTYSVAGRQGLFVGSNKIIQARDCGALIGKGLLFQNVHNVEVRDLSITDINPHVIWGGEAIDIQNSSNILIERCYIKNIGRQMFVTHYGSSTGILVKDSVFDGNTPYAPYCNNRHYWVWLIIGAGDQVAMQNNVVFHTSGRGPHIQAANNATNMLHMIQNTFYDIEDPGIAIDMEDPNSRILAEGNIYYDVINVIYSSTGHIFFPLTEDDAQQCQAVLQRDCLINTVVECGPINPKNDPGVIQVLNAIENLVRDPIDMGNSITNLTEIPTVVRQLIK